MSLDVGLPFYIVLSSLVPGMLIFFLPEERHRLRTILNMGGATVKMVLMGIMVWGVFHSRIYQSRWTLLPGMDLVLHADAMSILLASLSSVLWFVTTLYAIGYLEGSPNRSQFFGFFSICVSATVAIALAGNMLTFFVAYEALTISTYPLVMHRGTRESMRAGRIYLAYTLAGSAVLLFAVVWLHTRFGGVEFIEGGILRMRGEESRQELIVIFALLVAGLGVKSALVPLHGWLPVAMVAPAPVSALLHAVAVVKAGAFGIVRVVYDVYGVRFAHELGVLFPLALIAAITIVYGSVRALYQSELKKILAYSTVSQVSCIVLGSAIFGPIATMGGMVHLVHQGLMKITLFFCAGNLAQVLGVHRIEELDGVGRRMPLTMAAFTVGALGMIGVPPMAGFVSKWYLGTGALAAGQSWILLVLAASSALNAAYFLPLLHRAWFKDRKVIWPERQASGSMEAAWTLLLPPLITALLSVAVGLLASAPFSPLQWVRLIVTREYGL
jgi:multicomponent Na+:H+ antiporter subunit D